MDIKKLQRVIVDGLEDVKGQNIAVFNTEHLSSLFERVIIASGTSNRQTKALAASVRDAVKSSGFPVPRTEGEENGEWIIVDCGSAVVHLMQPNIREYYHLEELWGDKPVKIALQATMTRLVKASEPDEPVVKKVAGRKVAAKKVAAKKTARKAIAAAPVEIAPAAKKVAAKKAAANKAAPTRVPSKKSTARKATAKSTGKPADKPGVTRVIGVKRVTGAKTALSKAPAKAATKNAPAKKAPAKKAAAKKAPATKAASKKVKPAA